MKDENAPYDVLAIFLNSANEDSNVLLAQDIIVEKEHSTYWKNASNFMLVASTPMPIKAELVNMEWASQSYLASQGSDLKIDPCQHALGRRQLFQ